MELNYLEKLDIERALEYFIEKLKADNCSPYMIKQYEDLLERIELS